MLGNKFQGSRFEIIPLLDLQRQYAELRDEVLAAIERVCSSQQFILGSEVEELEHEVATLLGVRAAVGCASGTDALWLALAGSGLKSPARVITSPFSFVASATSIVRAGATPVFADINPETLNLEPLQVKRALEQASDSFPISAVLPVHLYGQCAPMDLFQEIADEHKLLVIEDAAQAFGAKWRGQSAGSLGVSAAFSFYPTKNLSAYGDAGMVTTQDRTLAERVRRLRNHGSAERYLHTEPGWNVRLDAIQAAVLRVKLKYIGKWNQQRRDRAQTYDRLLARAGLCAVQPATTPNNLKQSSWTSSFSDERAERSTPIELLGRSAEGLHVFHQYVIRASSREKLRRYLSARGIATEVYYPVPLHLQPVFAHLGYKQGDFPESERAAQEVLALPMFPELTEEEQKIVVAGIAEFYS